MLLAWVPPVSHTVKGAVMGVGKGGGAGCPWCLESDQVGAIPWKHGEVDGPGWRQAGEAGQAQGLQLLREHAFLLPVGLLKGCGQGCLVYLQGLIHPGIVQCWLLGLWLPSLAARGEEATGLGSPMTLPLFHLPSQQASIQSCAPDRVPQSILRGPHERESLPGFATHETSSKLLHRPP